MKYRDYIFDLYSTLVDIRTDEESPALWAALAEYYCRQGAPYHPDELHEAYRRLVSAAEQGAAPLRRDAHEATKDTDGKRTQEIEIFPHGVGQI